MSIPSLLNEHNITIADSLQSIEQVGRQNKVSPEEIVELIVPQDIDAAQESN